MPNRRHPEPTESSPKIPVDRHHGGQELPDDVQDRPEQNAGYDAAVRGSEPASKPIVEREEDLDVIDVEDLDREEEVDDDLPH